MPASATRAGQLSFTDYVENVLLTVLDFQLHTQTVVKAAQHYLNHAKAQTRSFQDLKHLLGRYPDTKEGNTEIALYLWGYKFWHRVRLLRPFLAYLESQGVTTQDQLKGWAERTTFAEFEGKVHGMGLGIFQWLVMRQGVETIKPDIWVHRFVEEAIGHDLPDIALVSILEAVAKPLQLKAYELDWRIWEHQRGSNMTVNNPHSVDDITLAEEDATLSSEVLEPMGLDTRESQDHFDTSALSSRVR